MAKVVKTIGLIVAGAGLIIATGGLAAGFSLGAVLGASSGVLGLSIGSVIAGGLAISALGSGLTHPKIPTSQTSRLTASIDPSAFRKTVLGQTAMATDVRYEEWSGQDQDYCDWIVALASHAIDGVEEIWLNTDLAWSATTGVTSKFAGYFWVPNIVLEGTPANAFTFGAGKWNAASSRLTGCAYLRLRFKVTGNSKKSDSPFSGGPPSRMTIIGRGAKLYDPRRDDTVPGGSGPMRWNDQSTWRYTTDDGAVIGENLPLQILFRVLGWRIRNPSTGDLKLAVGNGVPGRRIGMQSFQVAANLADELVNRSAGGQEPRYHGAGVISEGDDNKTVLDALCAGCCGRFRDTGGKLELVIAHNDLATAATDDGLNDDDVIGAFTWDPDPSLDQTPNVVRGKYVDPTTGSLYQTIDYPEIRLPSPDGQDRYFPLDLGYVESPSQAQRIGKQVLERKQYQRRFTAPFDIRAWKYPVGAVVPFTFAPLSFNRALFRVEEQELGQNGTCNMTLLVETEQIYRWDADDAAPVLPADAIVYDARNNPLILAIDEAATTANWSAVADDDGNKPEDNATNSADPDSPFGPGTVRDALEYFEQIDPLVTDVATLQGAQVGTDAALAALDSVTLDQAAAQRQATDDLDKVGQAMLSLLAEAERTRTVLRDAGIVVDPDTGKVRIYAVDQLADRTSSVEIDLDAQKSLITQKASVNYVDEQISKAAIDPGQVADLTALYTRMTSAETSIDGIDAEVALKADATTVSQLSGTVNSVSQDLNALEGTVTTKASQTEVDAQETRLGSVEQTLSTLGNVSGIAVTIRQARAVADDAAEASLRDLLAGDAADQRQIAQIAEVHQQLTTTIVDGLNAEALARTSLAVQIGTLNAQFVSEQKARIDGDTANAQDINALSAQNSDQAAAIATLQQASVDANGGIAGIQTTIRQIAGDGDVDGEAMLRALIAGDQDGRARLTEIAQVHQQLTTTLVAGQQATAATEQSLLVRIGAAESAIVSNAKAASDATGAVASQLNALQAAFYDPTTGVAATRATVAENKQAQVDGDSALAQSLQQVSSTQDDHTSSINFLLRATDGDEAVAQLDVDANGKITGFRINGAESEFVVAADRFIVGSSQIFEVDSTTGETVVNSLKAGVVTARELAGSAVQQTVFQITGADIVIAAA